MPHPRLRPDDPNDEPDDNDGEYWADELPWVTPICACDCDCLRVVEEHGQICPLCEALCDPPEED